MPSSRSAPSACAYVSRGGQKLEAALDAFGFDAKGTVALDIGASTGGFTEVLIARGAAKVYAVDVGRGQLHAKLSGRPAGGGPGRHRRAGARSAVIGEEVTAIVADVSFISLTLALPAALALAAPGAWLVALVKPQFEAGREAVGKGGIVRDAADGEKAVEKVRGIHRGGGLDGRRRDRLADSGRQRQRGIPDRRAPWSLRSGSPGSAPGATAWRTGQTARSLCRSRCRASR